MGNDFKDFDKFKLPKINLPEMPKVKLEMHRLPDFKLPEHIAPNTKDLERMAEEIGREKREQIQREKEMIALLRKVAEQQPPAIQQKIDTLIQDSTIHNMQNIHSGATGIQNITHNTGLQAEEVLQLLQAMRDLSDVLPPERALETQEVIADLETELEQPAPALKKGRVKAALTYMKSLANEIVVDPVKNLVKKEFIEYANSKASEVIEGIDKVIETLK